MYQRVDAAVDLDDKFDLVKKHGLGLYTYLDNQFRPLVQKVFFLYDEYTNRITGFIQVITTRHTDVQTYVTKTYTTAQVTVQGTWMRLDFDDDGAVSGDDLKHSLHGLYEFLWNFDLIEKTTQVKSKLYADAITYMQNELEEDKRA